MRESNEADLIGNAPRLVKVASATHIDALVRQALKGVALTHLPSPPTSIPVKLNYQYFSSTNQAEPGNPFDARGTSRFGFRPTSRIHNWGSH